MRIAVWVLLLGLVVPLQDGPPLPQDVLPPGPFASQVPSGFPEDLPAHLTRPSAASELGRTLFFDPILSADRSVSCASCHEPEHGFASREALPRGALGRRALRNAPTLFNRALGRAQMWDGRFTTLREQVLQPIANENEMALPLADAIARLTEDDGTAQRFHEVFGRAPDEAGLAEALAAFVEGLLYGDSAVDRFRAADASALDDAARTGLWLFESKGRCWRCHAGPNFSDESFHNTGVGVRDGVPEDGRFAVTGDESDRGRFKTPTLRGVALTAPYMHDGSIASLEEVVEYYRRGGNDNPHRDADLEALDLSDQDVVHLVAFLKALSPAPWPSR